MNEENWILYATEHNYKYIVIIKDLEDKDIYPVYTLTELEVSRIRDNIISETKAKIIKIISL